jgi:hypothetical protein
MPLDLSPVHGHKQHRNAGIARRAATFPAGTRCCIPGRRGYARTRLPSWQVECPSSPSSSSSFYSSSSSSSSPSLVLASSRGFLSDSSRALFLSPSLYRLFFTFSFIPSPSRFISLRGTHELSAMRMLAAIKRIESGRKRKR